MSSCAVVVCGMSDEAPFLHEFVAHYLSLGFDRIYYVNTCESTRYISDCIPKAEREHVAVLTASNRVAHWQTRALNLALPYVKEDWVLLVDVDEFLILGGRSIHEFLSSIPSCSVIRFRWHVVLSTAYAEPSVLGISAHQSRSAQFKSMARTAAIEHCGLHDIFLNASTFAYLPNPYDERAFVAHYACRGIYDLIGRVVGRNYGDQKSSADQVERLRAFFLSRAVSVQLYPFRFNLMRVELAFPHFPAPLPLSGSGVGSDIEMLHATFRGKMNRIGVRLPERLAGAELDRYMEERFAVQARLLRDLPDPSFPSLHLEFGISHQNITHAYVQSLEKRAHV